jgi:hypothetical protein
MYTPYQLQFGRIARNKLLNLPLDPHLLSSLETETQLLKHHKFDVSDSETEEKGEDTLADEDQEGEEVYWRPVLTKVLLDNHPNSFTRKRRTALEENGITENVLQLRVILDSSNRQDGQQSERDDQENINEENVVAELLGNKYDRTCRNNVILSNNNNVFMLNIENVFRTCRNNVILSNNNNVFISYNNNVFMLNNKNVFRTCSNNVIMLQQL